MKFRGEDIERKFRQTSLVFQAAAWCFADISFELGVPAIVLSFNDKLTYGRALAHPHIVFLDSFGTFSRYNQRHLDALHAKLIEELGSGIRLRYLKRSPGQPTRIWVGFPRELFLRDKNGIQKKF